MQISVRFTMAVELLLLCEHFKGDEKVNSTRFATKVDTSPFFTRQIMADLAKGGIIESRVGGTGGITLLKDLNDITLYDVYKCLGEDEGSFLKFAKPMHTGKYSDNQIQFHTTMEEDFESIKEAFENQLRKRTIGDYYKSYYNE